MKKTFFPLLLALMLLLGVMAVSATEKAVVSAGLCVLAERTDMAKTAIVGESISFSKEDFLRSLNLKNIKEITFETIPQLTDGRLVIGNVTLSAGDKIKGENLDLLKFVPASASVKKSSFDFSTGEGYSIRCNLYFVEKTNYSPTVSTAEERSVSIWTHDMVSRVGKLQAYDPEGDSFVYEITSYPKNGSLVLLERNEGRYVYTPRDNFSGKDSFSYVARDMYGNYSSAKEVSVDVRERRASVTFGDIDDCNVYNAALTVIENALMSGTEIDGVTYFSPEQTISRAEFLAAAMKAAGISEPAPDQDVIFDDDEDIPGEYKGYINTAYRLGYISGTPADGKLCFMPNATVTRAEAAVMLNAIVSAKKEASAPIVLPVFADSSQLPEWASDAIYSMNSLGVMESVDGYAAHAEAVTRGEAAQMFEAVINIYD